MRVTVLSGGVGGARLLRGLAALDVDLTAIVNVGDDESVYGLQVSPDVDTVIYTLAGRAGPQGWGLASDTGVVMDALDQFPIDVWFHFGDRDLATNIFRTARLADGWSLSQVTAAQAAVFGVGATVIPASDDPIRTQVLTEEAGWIPFQSYFVGRGHRDPIEDVRFLGASEAKPAAGVTDAILEADLVVIGPSNPPLSIWPILAVGEIGRAVERAKRVVGVSPLFGGRPLKGPADTVMRGLGLADGTAGVLAAYPDLLDLLYIDHRDAVDTRLATPTTEIRAAPTRIIDPDDATAFARLLVTE